MRMKPYLLCGVISRIEHNLSVPVKGIGRSRERFLVVAFYSTQRAPSESCGDNESRKVTLSKNLANLIEDGYTENEKMSLAKNLASLVQESCEISEQKCKARTRMGTRRFLEMRIKKKVKEQFKNGKFHDLMMNVVADPNTLRDAYDCIRVASNVDLASECDNLSFESMAQELTSGNFDVGAYTYSIWTRGPKVKEELVLPKMKLRIVQEAIRIVLDVVYRPHFSKISHGFRSGRDHCSALKYIRKEILDPDWWFSLHINKNIDDCILRKLILLIEDKIEDPNMCGIIKDMFYARVLNVKFGSFAKGHGLPQEGVLSPILMNIYLDLFDREIYRLSMQYEISESYAEEHCSHSKLRSWFRRQMSGSDVGKFNAGKNSSVRIHCCRFMDEIFFAVSGPKELAVAFKSDVESYLKNSLYLETDNQTDILSCGDSHGVQFLGTLIRRRVKENDALRAVHKLKDKVQIFAKQKQDSWEEGVTRIGKKWLAHGLKKVKESEIEHLTETSSILHQISCYRKYGMKTDHWYKVLLKVWVQDVNAKRIGSEETVLATRIVEPALPKELRDAYYEFQQRVQAYVSSETASMHALLPGFSSPPDSVYITEVVTPVNVIMKRLYRYGLTNIEGYARTSYVLMLLDDDQIINWFVGVVYRWLRWYNTCDNIIQVKQIISNQVRMSCIRTLAAKYRIHESVIEKKFDIELSRIPSTGDMELEEENSELLYQESKFDGALMYGVNYSGQCLVSLARIVSQSRRACAVMGCALSISCVYTLHVMERQKFPSWKTGFSSCIHPSLHRRRIGLCKQHLKDLFLGDISLQSIDFCSWR